MALEQQPLGPVANLLPRGQDEITWLPGLHEALPPEATRKRLSHLSALDPVGLKADSLLEGLEKRVFGSLVYIDLFVIGDMLAEPVVWHFSGDWGRLPLVATADDLDAPILEPVEEGFQGGALCRPLPRRSHGERISVPSFRASSPFGGRSCDRSGPGRPWPASLWPGYGSG